MLKRQLERSGNCRITTFDSGDQFLLGGSLLPWDVILIDKHMPGLSGFDTIATLRNSISRLAHTLSNTLVCMLSAAELDSKELQSAEDLGVCFFQKTATTFVEIWRQLSEFRQRDCLLVAQLMIWYRWRETASSNADADRSFGTVISPVAIPKVPPTISFGCMSDLSVCAIDLDGAGQSCWPLHTERIAVSPTSTATRWHVTAFLHSASLP